MFSTPRPMLLGVLAALLLVPFAAGPALAESWDCRLTTGLTSVESVFRDGTYTWTLTNRSSLPGDDDPSFDILVWELRPYQVREPLSVAAPNGWTWEADAWTLVASSRKYYTPDALGPGKSIVFLYTPNPSGAIINSHGPQPAGLGFIAHVGAVIPGSGSDDGEIAWQPVRTPFGESWYDRPTQTEDGDCAVPEPKGLLALGMAVCAMCVTARRKH